MSKLAKVHSKTLADRYLRRGWTLQCELRTSADDEPYEYVLEWERAEDAVYPDVRSDWAIGYIAIRLSCLELVVLTAAMFVAVDGPVPPRLRALQPHALSAIARVQAQCRELRDVAWSRAGSETSSTRAEVIAARLRTFVELSLEAHEAQLLTQLLGICADEVDARGDIVIVTGFREYGADPSHFRELRDRIVNAVGTG